MGVRRPRGPDDIRAVIRAHGLAWQEAYEGVLPKDVLDQSVVDPTEEQVQGWYEQVRNHSDQFPVAEVDGTIRGYAYFRWNDAETKGFVGEDEAGLKEIYVDPNYWREGIGTELLECGLDVLPDDVTALKLEMLSGNEAGRKFYEKHGFERTDTSEFEIGDRLYQTDIYTLQLQPAWKNEMI
jgi:ribosomal protein S18 acetylase RimI-like enzyme